MRALLLAAGLGTRLRPITNHTPKCLVEINGKPLMQYWFDLLDNTEINHILVNTHHLPMKVKDFVTKSSIANKVSIIDEAQLLGTGGTILRNKDFFQNSSFLVAHADNLTVFDLSEFINMHNRRPKGVDITMMTFNTDMPRLCGIVEVDDSGLVTSFHEKVNNPPGNKANAAVYIFEPSIIEFLDRLGKDTIDLSNEVLPFFLKKIQIYHNSKYHRDIGSPSSLMKANEDFSKFLEHNS